MLLLYGYYDMVTHIMKTTVEISDDLARRAKALAARKQVTLRLLIEQGLRHMLKEENQSGKFVLRDASVAGRGLQPEFKDKDWHDVRAASYAGRGG